MMKTLNRSNSIVGGIKWWPISLTNNNKPTFGSSVAVQKLRESKWFGPEESRILCAVLECGFVVEVREEKENEGWFGVAFFKSSKDKPKPENIEIYSIKIYDSRIKVIKMTLDDVWKKGCIIRINNFGDKENQAHNEKDIKGQITFAQKTKSVLWHNTQHFAYWCRYGNRQQDVRRRQMSECVKWGSVGMNAGMLLLINRQKAHTTAM